MIIFSYISAALWLFLPGGAANAVPVLASKLPGLRNWQTPLDGGKSFRGRRLLGDNKTLRGVLAGVLTGAIVAGLQHAIGTTAHLPALSLHTALIVGALMGLGALLGDAVESFFKRQRDVRPGSGWFPFDQIDYIIGGLLLSYPLVHPSWQVLVSVIGAWFGIHLVTVYICYLLGIRDHPI